MSTNPHFNALPNILPPSPSTPSQNVPSCEWQHTVSILHQAANNVQHLAQEDSALRKQIQYMAHQVEILGQDVRDREHAANDWKRKHTNQTAQIEKLEGNMLTMWNERTARINSLGEAVGQMAQTNKKLEEDKMEVVADKEKTQKEAEEKEAALLAEKEAALKTAEEQYEAGYDLLRRLKDEETRRRKEAEETIDELEARATKDEIVIATLQANVVAFELSISQKNDINTTEKNVLRLTIDSLRGQLQHSQNKQVDLEKALTEAEKRYTSTIETLRRELADQLNKNTKHNSDLNELRAKHETQLEQVEARHRDSLSRAKGIEEEWRNKYTEEHKSFEASEKKRQLEQQEVQRLHGVVKNVERQRDAADAKLRDAAKKEKNTDFLLKRLYGELSTLSKQASEDKMNAASRLVEKKEAEKAVEEMKGLLQQEKEKVDALEKDVKDAEAKAREAVNLQAKLNETDAKVKSMQNMLNKADEMMTNERKRRDSVEAEKNATREELSEERKKVDGLSQKVDGLNRKLEEKQAEVESKTKELKEVDEFCANRKRRAESNLENADAETPKVKRQRTDSMSPTSARPTVASVVTMPEYSDAPAPISCPPFRNATTQSTSPFKSLNPKTPKDRRDSPNKAVKPLLSLNLAPLSGRGKFGS